MHDHGFLQVTLPSPLPCASQPRKLSHRNLLHHRCVQQNQPYPSRRCHRLIQRQLTTIL
uniref:Uncharacterized basic polypeptide n=1 Tax=Phaseolus vulgaris TaxID=3885 RepID=YBAS_PHAVU|nr:RecName: Full=Uncharacterized basic polypeptide [Phaseolus vulgaris]